MNTGLIFVIIIAFLAYFFLSKMLPWIALFAFVLFAYNIVSNSHNTNSTDSTNSAGTTPTSGIHYAMQNLIPLLTLPQNEKNNDTIMSIINSQLKKKNVNTADDTGINNALSAGGESTSIAHTNSTKADNSYSLQGLSSMFTTNNIPSSVSAIISQIRSTVSAMLQ